MSIQSPLWLTVFLLTGCVAEPLPAENCSVVENDDGSATVTCPDGSSTTLNDGTNGIDGTTGGDGTDGAAALIRVDEEPPGTSCENGGLAIHVGLDDDGDGLLSDPEIDSTEYMCDGSDGSTGPTGANGTAALLRMEDLEPGDECRAGGVVIYAGNDTDGDSYLDAGEITDTAYVCDGESASSSASAEVEFPSAISVTPSGGALGGGGGGSYYRSGDTLTQTFTATGVSSVEQLDVTFRMYDGTSASCRVGTLSWDVSINDTVVGSYSTEGGRSAGAIEFVESYTFDAIDGAGADGEAYELSFTATTTVCGGGGSWNWYSGGTAILTGSAG